MAAEFITDITSYSEAVVKRLGREYSLYTTRAIELLPEVIRLTLQNGTYEQNELFKDNDNNGTVIEEMSVIIPATAKSHIDLDKNEATMLYLLTRIYDANMVTADCDFSIVTPEEFNSVKYRQFDVNRPQFAGYIDSNQLIVYNPTSPLTTAELSITIKRTQFLDTILNDVTTNLVDYFSYNLLLQMVQTGAELLKQEITL